MKKLLLGLLLVAPLSNATVDTENKTRIKELEFKIAQHKNIHTILDTIWLATIIPLVGAGTFKFLSPYPQLWPYVTLISNGAIALGSIVYTINNAFEHENNIRRLKNLQEETSKEEPSTKNSI